MVWKVCLNIMECGSYTPEKLFERMLTFFNRMCLLKSSDFCIFVEIGVKDCKLF